MNSKLSPKLFFNKFFTNQVNLSENDRKGTIFTYFLGTTFLFAALVTLSEVFLIFTDTGPETQTYITYTLTNFVGLVILAAIWFAHRRYPRLARHIFLAFLVLGAVFLFDVDGLNRFLIIFSLPIIMAAFLLDPIYSFVYYFFIAGLTVSRLYLADLNLIDNEGLRFNLTALIVLATVSWLIAQSLDSALNETRALNKELDKRVQDRTRELAATLEREKTLAARNNTILQSIADGIIVFDAGQRVLMANLAANQLAKRNLQSAFLNEILESIIDDPDNHKERFKASLNGSTLEHNSNIQLNWHNKTLSANIAPVVLPQEDNQQVDAGHIVVLRDFTKEAELQKAKDIFFGMVSHELRTPMSAINGYVEVLLDLEKGNISEEGVEFLHTIRESTQQLLSLANDLIDLSRLETGEIELYSQWVDIADIVQQAVKIVQQEFNTRGLSLAVEIEPELPQLYIDSRRILQVLLNLLSNAYKYTNKGGAIVNVGKTEQEIQISVRDTGIGIQKSDQAHLFTRFFRAADQAIQKAGGTGLGLSISKGMVELHGGNLTFESEYRKGTTFNLALPLDQVKVPQ